MASGLRPHTRMLGALVVLLGALMFVVDAQVATLVKRPTPNSFLGSCTDGSYLNNHLGPTATATLQGTCSLCPDGTSTQDFARCTPCKAGWYSDSTRTDGSATLNSLCKVCLKGTVPNFLPPFTTVTAGIVTGATSCTSCLAGQYTSFNGATVCQSCPPGSFSASAGSSSCALCTAGTYQGSASMTACGNCVANYYSHYPGATMCQACELGYSAVAGSSSCTACAAGSYRDSSATVCTVCPVNTFASGTGSAQCSPCPSGTSTGVTTGQSSCSACAAGTTSTFGGACSDCPVGTYVDTPGLPICYPCPAGQYADLVKTVSCTACLPGSFNYWQTTAYQGWETIGNGAAAFPQLPVSPLSTALYTGTASDPWQAQCFSCPAGTVQAVAGSTSCSDCTKGTISAANGATTCTACAVGTSSFAVSHFHVCTVCPVGYYGSKQANLDCQKCPPGYFQDGTDALQCKACPAGQFSYTAAAACLDCPAGWFTRTAGTPRCSQARAGFLANKAVQATGEQACRPGQFSIKGSYVSAATTYEQCLSCPIDTYGTNVGQAICTGCATGYHTCGFGSTKCIPDNYTCTLPMAPPPLADRPPPATPPAAPPP